MTTLVFYQRAAALSARHLQVCTAMDVCTAKEADSLPAGGQDVGTAREANMDANTAFGKTSAEPWT